MIAARADADKPNLGLTSWDGATIRKSDVVLAKNYLQADEIEALNLKPHGYPPDKREDAVVVVIEQAERVCRDWARVA